MKTLSSDTHVDIEIFHVELIRKASISRRLEMVDSLVKTTRQLSWLGICDRYPDDSVEEHIERFITLLYEDRVMAQRIRHLVRYRKRTSVPNQEDRISVR